MPAFLNGQSFQLKHLFEVEYLDGSRFKQPSDDHSELDPKRSAFFDVLESKKEIKTFTLGNLQVNLLDGSFEVNGQKIQVGENPLPGKRQLIFFRQHQHDYNSKTFVEVEHRIKYFLGWQQNIKGKNYKEVIGIE